MRLKGVYKVDYMPTLKDLIQDLQLAKEIAIRNEQPNPLVTAVMAQAKLLGLLDEPQQADSVAVLSALIDEISETGNDTANS